MPPLASPARSPCSSTARRSRGPSAPPPPPAPTRPPPPGQPGPVALLFHSTALSGTVGPATTPRLYSTAQYLPSQRESADPEDVSASVEALAQASKPVIL